jgi:AcrR family transcriptional regulator
VLFATHGYQAIGLRDLAVQLGVHPGSMYNHIENKRCLLFELMESVLSDLLLETQGLQVMAGYGRHMSNRQLQRAYLSAVLMMGSLVMVYNFLGFRLTQAPFDLSQTAAGSLFLTYLTGIYASTYVGKLADRHGPRPVSACSLAL